MITAGDGRAVRPDSGVGMELRVPGIGGPSAESVLGCEPGYAVTTWRSQDDARSRVCHTAAEYTTHAYDWRPLTSGSRSFAAWPLLLPFTVVNLSGWMGPASSRPLRQAHRYAAVALALTVTANCVVFLTYAAWVVWAHVAPGSASEPWLFWVAVVSSAAAVGLIVLSATIMAAGYDRYRPPSWTSKRRWRGVWGAGIAGDLRDERFYDNGAEHAIHWRVHLALAVLTLAGVIVAVVSIDGAGAPARGFDLAFVVSAIAVVLPLVAMILVALPKDGSRRLHTRLVGAGSAVVGVMLLGGLVLSALIAFVGMDGLPPGPPVMLYDVYGWSLLGAVAVAGVVVAVRLQTAVAGEGTSLLRSTWARLRARLAPAVGDFDVVVTTTGLIVVAGGAVAIATRWLFSDGGHAWRLTSTAPVQLARSTFAFLIAALVINVVKSRADPAVLRRIGNIWDIITFWPRTFHPFAVRPYAERAVPELREYLVGGGRPAPVLAAHSQGTVLVFAALLPVAEHPDIRLVTFGSPLRTLYAKGFPSCVSVADVADLRDRPGVQWTNLFRCTDHVGRALHHDTDGDAIDAFLVWRPGMPPLDDRPIAEPSPAGVVEGHNNYWATPEVRAAVAGPRPADLERTPA